ncbi:MAG: hypothetical protein IKB75_01490 [Clostridia bacterium]|nr:hypothetical protein [Clostridia bacterium]
MEDERIIPVRSTENKALDASVARRIEAMSDRFAHRGLSRAVHTAACEQIEREAQTRELSPDAYRLSSMSEPLVSSRYRRGKEDMDTQDLLAYVQETRQMRTRGVDFSDDAQEEPEEEQTALCKPEEVKPATARNPVALAKRMITRASTWIDTSRPNTAQNRRSFPLSAFASLAVLAACLALIVASSVMLNEAEERVIELGRKVDNVAAEVAELQSDWEVRNNLIQIRKIAVEEYGMVEEEYVKIRHLSAAKEDSVESFDEKQERRIRLSALLSAIGIEARAD